MLPNVRKINEDRILEEDRTRKRHMASPAANQEALADPNYNPEIDPKVKQLYNLMTPCDGGPEDADLLAEYQAYWDALPTKNIYTQVLVNPLKCDIGVVTGGLGDLVTYLPVIRSQLPSEDQATWDTMVSTVTPQITEIQGNLDAWDQHSDKLTANLPTLAGIAQGALGILSALNNLLNPCAGLSNFLGSIMDKGKQLLDQVKAQIMPLVNQVKSWAQQAIGAVSQMTAAIQSAIGQAKALMSQAIGMIQSEVQAFIGAMIGQLRMGLAEFMSSMKLDPCLAGVLGGIAGPAAAAILG